jgi:hypothetical protein
MRLVSMSFSVETLHFFGRVAGAADASSPHVVEHASRFAFAAAVAHAVGGLAFIGIVTRRLRCCPWQGTGRHECEEGAARNVSNPPLAEQQRA